MNVKYCWSYIQRAKVGKGGCWSAEALFNADKRNTWFFGRELLTAVVTGNH